ncbi:hypothetical protein HanPI659440_Chr05g0207471 [Helianthus annuus]|nr:hypothetical protein HanPI659440_Chr05g0207471 [Helianthus annuus]
MIWLSAPQHQPTITLPLSISGTTKSGHRTPLHTPFLPQHASSTAPLPASTPRLPLRQQITTGLAQTCVNRRRRHKHFQIESSQRYLLRQPQPKRWFPSEIRAPIGDARDEM